MQITSVNSGYTTIKVNPEELKMIVDALGIYENALMGMEYRSKAWYVRTELIDQLQDAILYYNDMQNNDETTAR